MREQQTLGRRIQEARKAAGLSQESLGERLGVSRQAVSKWEADAAVPELENLIAMSRIFGVTIGALLGVEPPEAPSEGDAPESPGDGAEDAAPAGELTDRELAAVEGAFTPSAFVRTVTGVDNVCERAALLGAERLLVKKTARDGVTVAVAAEHWEVRFG